MKTINQHIWNATECSFHSSFFFFLALSDEQLKKAADFSICEQQSGIIWRNILGRRFSIKHSCSGCSFIRNSASRLSKIGIELKYNFSLNEVNFCPFPLIFISVSPNLQMCTFGFLFPLLKWGFLYVVSNTDWYHLYFWKA